MSSSNMTLEFCGTCPFNETIFSKRNYASVHRLLKTAISSKQLCTIICLGKKAYSFTHEWFALNNLVSRSAKQAYFFASTQMVSAAIKKVPQLFPSCACSWSVPFYEYSKSDFWLVFIKFSLVSRPIETHKPSIRLRQLYKGCCCREVSSSKVLLVPISTNTTFSEYFQEISFQHIHFNFLTI